MSAWVVALGLAAGYLVNKNMQIGQQLEQKVKTYNDTAEPANPGPTTQAIRAVQRTVPEADKYQDLNMQDLSAKDVRFLTQAREAAHQEVATYEAGPPPIQGVYLNFSDRVV